MLYQAGLYHQAVARSLVRSWAVYLLCSRLSHAGVVLAAGVDCSMGEKSFVSASTLIVVAAAGIADIGYESHYLYSPWTRDDAEFSAEIITIAPDVSGWAKPTECKRHPSAALHSRM